MTAATLKPIPSIAFEGVSERHKLGIAVSSTD